MENIETLLAAVAQTQGFDEEPAVAVATPPEVPGSSGGAPPIAGVSAEPVAATPPIGSGERRKRGRPPKGQLAASPPVKRRKLEEEEEEDVCFICFDGGSLVLCDRKGCPKAYHPACIKRDEAFFKSKAKWNCGWHICSVCRKASHYMCYTCTYSLCKGCTRNEDYACVRGNKGFCLTCMKTIMLIENKDQSVQVDFDDKTSWEYLFKVYWVILKEKLSLTLSELTQAKPPSRGVPTVACKPQLSNVPHAGANGKVSVSSMKSEHLELNMPCVETGLLQNDELETTPSSIESRVDKLNHNDGEGGPGHDNDTAKVNVDKVIDNKKDQDKSTTVEDNDVCRNTDNKGPDRTGTGNSTDWATKDLLEFVAFVRNGDTSAMSPFDVQSLLLDYIKRNNLRDPRQKGQIVCDQRLKNLFGKPRVGHIEMLKLLEFHFPMEEVNSLIPAGFVASDVEVDGITTNLPTSTNSRKRKTRKRNQERVTQNNINEYAAIDPHNIILIYLRRNLVENLLENQENFNNKVIGSIVRIRTSSNDQKQDIYRLVQVVGTIKVAEPYKIGERTTNIMLEVLNLYKKEVVSIDAISNQEFTEDECRRLRQSIRCGLVKLLTVGEVQKIALALQPVRIKDRLEAEILRLNHLRDRASENGRKKELREHVDRLELLKSPEEQQRRIVEVPEIHADPKMSPNFESDEEEETKAKSGDNSKNVVRARPSSGFPQNGKNPISPNKKGKKELYIHAQNRARQKTDANWAHSSDKPINITNSIVGGKNDQAIQRTGLETLITTPTVENPPSTNNIETEKLWHYRDPQSKIQGPFAMVQLRKWKTTGLFFPSDMRIWTNHEQYDSLLLTDALIGHLHEASESSFKQSSGAQENGTAEDIGESEGTKRTCRDSKQTEANNVCAVPNKNSGSVKENASDSSWPQCWDLLNDKDSSANNAQERKVLPLPSHGQADVAQPVQGRGSDEFNHGVQNGEKNSSGSPQNQVSSRNELQNQCNVEKQATQPNGENLRSLDIDLSSNLVVSESVGAPDLNKHVENIDLSDLRGPTPTNTENQPSVSGILELLSPTPRLNNEDATEAKQSGILDFPVADSDGQGWSVASSLVAGGVQLPDVANEWCGYSPTPVKPSIPEWDSSLASESSLKAEIRNEYAATSISDGHQMSQAPPPHPASNASNFLELLNEPIVFDALGEELMSDLFAEADARESHGTIHSEGTMHSQSAICSPTAALKFAREFLEDCNDDCFSSIEDFNPMPDPQCDASGSTGDMQMTSQSSCNPIKTCDAFDSFRKSSVNSSGSSEGETNAQVYSGDAGSEFHPPAPSNPSQDVLGHTNTATSSGSDPVDPGWGTVQGNINLVTVQGNVNLVLGPGQGMANLGWGTNPGTAPAWVNPSMNHSPRNGSLHLPWDGQQRKYGGERFTSPRAGYQGNELGFGRGRPPRGRQTYNGGYLRPLPKGQRVCKFYESGHCKKGAFCDYLHP